MSEMDQTWCSLTMIVHVWTLLKMDRNCKSFQNIYCNKISIALYCVTWNYLKYEGYKNPTNHTFKWEEHVRPDFARANEVLTVGMQIANVIMNNTNYWEKKNPQTT